MRTLREGWRILRAHRELWVWCALPLVLNLALFALAAWVFWLNVGSLAGWIGTFLEVAKPEVWYQWIWVGPILALQWMLSLLLFAAFAVVLYMSFTVVGGVVASPFLGVLSERVEKILTGSLAETPVGWGALVAVASRALLEESKRAAFFFSVQLAILALGLLPGLQPVALVADLAFFSIFLPLDYTGFALDRREVRFRERRDWIWTHKRRTFPFGMAALATLFVPGLNFLCLPWFVASGTWLALELGPPAPRA